MFDLDPIRNLPIKEVVSRHTTLIRSGANFKANCPIHNEKTPSFVIFPRTNTFKCFGCGAGGNAITFIMNLEHKDFIEACKQLSAEHNLNIDFKDTKPVDPVVRQRRDRYTDLMFFAQQYFSIQLFNTIGEKALEYARSRWSDDIIRSWAIGYALDDWHAFELEAIKANFTREELLAVGLISESKGKHFDTFRNRLMFPICNQHGQVIAFSGRILPDSYTSPTSPTGPNSPTNTAPKYINSPETEIYQKSKTFFGLHNAIAEIRKTNVAYLVEGNPDVIRLQDVGPVNTIAPLGTGISPDQVTWLQKNCKSVIIIGDGDKAGRNAVITNAEKLIRAGLFVNVINLPDDENKQDPDSFFSANNFNEYASKNLCDYIIWITQQRSGAAGVASERMKIISHISELIACFHFSTREYYIEQVSTIIKPKKAWQGEVAMTVELNNPPEQSEEIHERDYIPAHVNASDFEKYGFYEDKNQYFFRTNKGVIRGANFIMKPLFHVQSVIDAKRLFEIVNEFGYSQVIELAQRDLVSLQAFKLRVESLGNFIWEASDIELGKLKRFIYEKTETCTEIKQLGWQKHGFWAWGNGIYNGSYSPANEFGIVRHNEVNYYIPAFSKIYAKEDSLFVSERKFIHVPGTITMPELIQRFEAVFGLNARVAYCFYLATCFRDFIVSRFGFFPILNLFGPKGAGKTEMAISMLYFFGRVQKGPNINNTSKAALADHIAQHSNALCHIDEYKNNIEFEKVEFLKGIWDGTGRTRMNMDKDKKKETTNVDIGLMLTGQEMPTADIALFSRLIFLTFTQTEYSEEEKQRFNELKDILNCGITHLTHQVLSHRSYFIENYFDKYDYVCNRFMQMLGETIIEDRIFRNWAICIAAFVTINDKVPTAINLDQLFELAVSLMIRQNSETKRTNDVANFWEICNFLVKEGEIIEGVDFIVKSEKKVTINSEKSYSFDDPKQILYLNHTRIFQKYRKHGASTRDFVLPVKTLEYYLMNSKEYLGKKSSCAFLMKQGDNPETVPLGGANRRQITTAHTFLYDHIVSNYGINFVTSELNEMELAEITGDEHQPAVKYRTKGPGLPGLGIQPDDSPTPF